MVFFDVIVTTWVLAIGAYARWHVLPIFMVAGGVTFLYLLYHIEKNGMFAQTVQALLLEIDIISFPMINKNQTFFKLLINVALMVLIYVVADWVDLPGIFYLCLALFIAFFILFLYLGF